MLTLNLEDPLKSGTTDQNKKKKQKLVKHKRKNWKKTDIVEIEQGVEELRQQKNHGGVLAEKKDEDLFYIQKEKIPNSISENVEPLKKKRFTLEEKLENLKCYKNLKPDPLSHPAHIINDYKKPEENSKRQQKIKEKRKKFLKKKLEKIIPSKETDKENTVILNDIIKKKKKVKKIVSRPKERKNVIIETNFEEDIWNGDEKQTVDEIEENFLKYTKQILTKKPENPIQPKSAVPKLEVPHPGASYNPDYDDHQALLLRAHLIELDKLKKEQKEMRKQTNNIKKMSWDEIEKVWLEEMAIDSLFNQTEVAEEQKKTDDIDEKLSTKKEKKNNETRAKRKRKQLLEKLKLKEKENEKQQRIQQNEIFRLKSIRKEINEEELKREEQRLKKLAEQEQKDLFTPKRLGSLKYEEPEIELKLSNEITGNLRTLKPEGNIMVDRYKSLQKRNIIEPRDKAKSQRKFWKKKFDKKNAYEKTYFVK